MKIETITFEKEKFILDKPIEVPDSYNLKGESLVLYLVCNLLNLKKVPIIKDNENKKSVLARDAKGRFVKRG